MTIIKRMSHEEIRQQHETITSIDSKVSVVNENVSEGTELLKKMWKLAPYIGGLCTLIGGIAGFAIGASDWNRSLVKQPQLAAFEVRAIRADSILNAKIDTVADKVNKLPKLRFSHVTQHKDRNGNVTERNYD